MSHSLDETRRIDREAAAWMVKRDRGLAPAEQDEFFSWLAADPRHGEWFSRHQETWREFNLLAEWKPEHSAEPNSDLLARTQARRAPILRWVGWGALAAAACIAIAFVWFNGSSPQPLAPGSALAAAQAYERRALEDGSILELNRGARVEVAYAPAERRVRLLTGEAHFTVAKNPARPFIVRAGGVDVRAVGTAFNVKIDDRQVRVLVTEGKVRVNDAMKGSSLLAASASGAEPVLEKGQAVTLDVIPQAPARVMAVDDAALAHVAAWRPEVFDFNSESLANVVEAFNRRNTVRLVIADPELRDMPIVASIRSDNLDAFVRLLELTANLESRREGDTITLRKAR